jgi:dTDP-4-amino-4,6-dideoxygalactose transaminase
MLPLVDVGGENAELAPRLEAALGRVARSGRYILGPEVERFEGLAGEFLGVRHALGVSNGSDALVCALSALDIGPGDEVITTPLSFVASSESILRVGATPRFADVDPISLQLDPSAVRANITTKTRAIIAVHLYGSMAPAVELRALADANGIGLIEDAAQAFGASHAGRRAGTLGHLGCFSFFPSKPLGALGDGGLVVTGDPVLAARVRALRSHGLEKERQGAFVRVGGNFRLDELQAAVLSEKLPFVDTWRAAREINARAYSAALEPSQRGAPSLVLPTWGNDERPAFSLYTPRVTAAARPAVLDALRRSEIEARVYYARPLHMEPMFAPLGHRAGEFPHAERATGEVFSIPIHARLGREARTRVVEAIRSGLALGRESFGVSPAP